MSLARLVVTAVLVEGRPKAAVARDNGVSRRWVHELVRRFQAGGEGLGGAVGGGGAAFTGTVLNVPLWIVLIAALFAAGVVAVAIGRRRRRSAGTGS